MRNVLKKEADVLKGCLVQAGQRLKSYPQVEKKNVSAALYDGSRYTRVIHRVLNFQKKSLATLTKKMILNTYGMFFSRGFQWKSRLPVALATFSFPKKIIKTYVYVLQKITYIYIVSRFPVNIYIIMCRTDFFYLYIVPINPPSSARTGNLIARGTKYLFSLYKTGCQRCQFAGNRHWQLFA
jgi:hypothetical protein